MNWVRNWVTAKWYQRNLNEQKKVDLCGRFATPPFGKVAEEMGLSGFRPVGSSLFFASLLNYNGFWLTTGEREGF
jgi:hypothetical protein